MPNSAITHPIVACPTDVTPKNGWPKLQMSSPVSAAKRLQPRFTSLTSAIVRQSRSSYPSIRKSSGWSCMECCPCAPPTCQPIFDELHEKEHELRPLCPLNAVQYLEIIFCNASYIAEGCQFDTESSLLCRNLFSPPCSAGFSSRSRL